MGGLHKRWYNGSLLALLMVFQNMLELALLKLKQALVYKLYSLYSLYILYLNFLSPIFSQLYRKTLSYLSISFVINGPFIHTFIHSLTVYYDILNR